MTTMDLTSQEKDEQEFFTEIEEELIVEYEAFDYVYETESTVGVQPLASWDHFKKLLIDFERKCASFPGDCFLLLSKSDGSRWAKVEEIGKGSYKVELSGNECNLSKNWRLDQVEQMMIQWVRSGWLRKDADQ